MGTHLHRWKWALLAASAAALTLTAIAGAGHDTMTPYSPAGVLHLNVGNEQNLAGATGRSCESSFGCLQGFNLLTGSGQGLLGEHSSNGTGAGVEGVTFSISNDAVGVLGRVVGSSPGAGSAAVRGRNSGTGALGVGVSGTQQGSGIGVWGATPNGFGVVGEHTGPTGTQSGVWGQTNSSSDLAAGVKGEAPNGSLTAGVYGSSSAFGVLGIGSAAGVVGYNPPGLAGYFIGNVVVTGTLTKGAGAFRIDHPLDPAGKYLQHSFVESPDMKNVYDGVVTTDRRGFATVRLARYFQALNRSFRYQLTGVGRAAWGARMVVWKEIAGNHFVIRSEPHVKISWQVTGVRKDRYADANRIQPELAKGASERGQYLHPELYGKSQADSIMKLPRTLVARG